MRLNCPACGAQASLEAWLSEPDCIEVLGAVGALPSPIAEVLPHYLALFRPGTRVLTWKKAFALLRGLADLVAPGVVRVQGKPPRPCPPSVWAGAMARMAASGTIERPLLNHHYLRHVAHGLASVTPGMPPGATPPPADAEAEKPTPFEKGGQRGISDKSVLDAVHDPLAVARDTDRPLSAEQRLDLYRESLKWNRRAMEEYGEPVLTDDEAAGIEAEIKQLEKDHVA